MGGISSGIASSIITSGIAGGSNFTCFLAQDTVRRREEIAKKRIKHLPTLLVMWFHLLSDVIRNQKNITQTHLRCGNKCSSPPPSGENNGILENGHAVILGAKAVFSINWVFF
jgi:hypothetical protein